MKRPITVCLAYLLLVTGPVIAEIYETKDAQGNTVFTDQPTADAERVELKESNVADSVEPRPYVAPEKPHRQPHTTQPAPDTTGTEMRDDAARDEEREEWLEQEIAEDGYGRGVERGVERAAERREGDGPVHARPLPARHPHTGLRR